jgi:D-sedoheptulose 7-phosphate isomerase
MVGKARPVSGPDDTARTFSDEYLDETIAIVAELDRGAIEAVAAGLASVRGTGRLFVLGVGGSAAHASHAVNDFRKICGFEAYTPTDNAAELTARINDDGWDDSFAAWLAGSRLASGDALLVFSVGGGSREHDISVNLVRAIELARERGAKTFGIVGRDGGYTASVADACVVIPPLVSARVTPHTEGLCAVVWHLVVSHPLLAQTTTKWESARP